MKDNILIIKDGLKNLGLSVRNKYGFNLMNLL
jgi:hypothetical protein